MRQILVILALFWAGCGGAQASRMEPRFVAVHNAMAAMGMAQTGAISEGSLPQGADARIRIRLEGGECYTFVALGSGGVADIDVRVVGEDDEDIARDTTHDPQAAAQACPDESGEYSVIVRMVSGQGDYVVSSWSGAVGGGGGGTRTARRGGDQGTCESPIALTVGTPITGTTTGGQSRTQGSCVRGNAPERVYRIEVANRVQLGAVLQSTYDGALYLLRECGQEQSELACNDDAPNTQRSQIDATLEPGTYYLVVDGYNTEAGDYELIVSTSELQPLAAICGDAPPLQVGQPMQGTTAGQPNYFQATCAGGARSADRVYRVDVQARSRMRLRLESDHDAAIYVRRSCEDPTTEIACNDDYVDQRHALVTAVLEPGRYFVYADGFGTGNQGDYTINAEIAPEAGGGAAGDSCTDNAQATPGQRVNVDTLAARDDTSGSCGGSGAPDVMYRVDVQNRSRLRATINEPQFAGAVYIQRSCGNAQSEVMCAAIQQGAPGAIDATVTPGTYWVVVDGASPDQFGAAGVDIHVDDLAALERDCRTAPMLRPGRSVSGNTTSTSDRFQASCAGNAESNDVVYRLRLTRRQIVRLNVTSDYDSALYLRRDCADRNSELACNDDNQDNRHAFIETTLDAGMYYVVVDGFRTGNNGTFTLDVQTSNP